MGPESGAGGFLQLISQSQCLIFDLRVSFSTDDRCKSGS